MTRPLMNEIDWSHRLIGIKGPRGVGKTTFLLQYAKKNFNVNMGRCLYINMNSFYFQGRGIVDFPYMAKRLRESGYAGDMFLHGIYDPDDMPRALVCWTAALSEE